MALTYPHTVTFDDEGTILEFDDGLRITVPGQTFDGSYEVTIDKEDPVELSGEENLSYGYKVTYSGSVPDPLPPSNKHLFVHVPLAEQVAMDLLMTVHTNGTDFPDPTNWTPQPDEIYAALADVAFVQLDVLASFQVTTDA